MTLLFAMISFALAMSITPGPVNMVILSSGIHHGVKKTMPYVSGATIGFTLLLLAIGFGFAEIIQTFPFILKYLAVMGSFYIMYIGYKIATAKYTLKINAQDPPQFYEGFLLQWLNPKAWIACVSGVSIFSNIHSYDSLLTFSGIYFIVCYLSLCFWAVLGDKVSHLLKKPIHLRLFNLMMVLILIITAGYLCYGQWY